MYGTINRNFTIFGATGDLSYRKLMPALYNLFATGKLDDNDRIIAIGRRDYSEDQYIKIVKKWVKEFSRVPYDPELFAHFAGRILYYQMDFTDLSSYHKLSAFFHEHPIDQNFFYYAVSPALFDVISDGIISIKCSCKSKVIVEKPFGETIEEASRLSKKLESCFGKDNVYRIDHYLGKEMVRNISTIRFGNRIFKNSWDNNSIEHIQIIASEEVGVETRAAYYDKAGALKDMVQNHLLQILTLVAMENPTNEKDITQCQIDVLKSLRPIENSHINDTLILAQYEGYRDEKGVNPQSKTDTFAFMKLFIDNERFSGVPFYILTGKKMLSREMNVIVTFKTLSPDQKPEILIFKIQPQEGVSIGFNINKPGNELENIQAEMDFSQNTSPSHTINTPEAYERLLYAAVMSDSTSFSSWEQIELSWSYIEKLKTLYLSENLPIYTYPVGSRGPSEMSEIFEDISHKPEYTQFYCKI